MTGKLKTKGNIMLATKLDGLLKVTILYIHLSVDLMNVFQGVKAKL
jgi:hypothetical protein